MEVKHDLPNRVSYSKSVRTQSGGIESFKIEKAVPSGTYEIDFLEEVRTLLCDYIKATLKEDPEVSQMKADFSQNQCPKCPICGSATKPTKSGRGYNCVNSKWKKEGTEWVNSGCQGYVRS